MGTESSIEEIAAEIFSKTDDETEPSAPEEPEPFADAIRFPTEDVANPFANSIAIQIRQHRWGVHRKVRPEEVQIQAKGEKVNDDVITLNKALVKSREYDAIMSLDNRLRSELEKLSVPAMLEEATVLVPLALVGKAREIITAYLVRRPVLVQQFVDFYTTDCLNKQATRLGPLYRRDQYPAPGDVQLAFSVEVRYRSFGVPGELKSVDQAAYEEAVAEVRKEMVSATAEIRSAMRAGLLQLVSHLQDRLSGQGTDGKPARLYDTAVDNLRAWLEIFDQRNLTNDAQLRELVDQCRGVIDGTGVDDLRKNKDLRAVVADALLPVKEALTGLVGEAPVRQFNFGDD